MKFTALLAGTMLAGSSMISAQTISSCGSSSDILSNAVITTNPSPIDKSKPFTLTIKGSLTQDVTAGNIDVNLNVKALGIINEPVTSNTDFTYSPGFPKGDVSVSVGPLQLPSAASTSEITGTVKIAESSGGTGIMCIQFSDSALTSLRGFNIESEKFEAGPVASNCGTSSDHLSNVQIAKNGTTTIVSGTLDEDLPSLTTDVDLEVKASFIKIPIKMTVPASLTPAIPKGDIKATFTPVSNDELESPQITVTVNGQVKANDGNGEEVACLQLTE
jgi:hypothetical protein